MEHWNQTEIVLFEDEAVSRLRPLTDARPVFELVTGAFTLRRRVAALTGQDPPAALVRPHLAPLIERLGLRDFRAVSGDGPWTFVNGAALLDGKAWSEIAGLGEGRGLLTPAGRLVAFRCSDQRTVKALSRGKASLSDCGLRFSQSEGVRLIGHLWDLITAHGELLGSDLERLLGAGEGPAGSAPALSGAFLQDAPTAGIHIVGGPVFVREGAELLAPVACDARGGPILIGRGAQVKPFSLLEGPLVIGEGTIVLGGRVAASYLGPGCRIAGEVSDSVFLGWSNKAHAGFVGHSYAGEWVNLGAMTTTSNLKNTYGSVRCWENGEPRDSGCLKLGAFLGDHVRTAIGMLLEGGSHIGLGTNLVGGPVRAPKWVPPFVWGAGADAEEYDWARFMATVTRVQARRDRVPQGWEDELLQHAFEESAGERRAYLQGLAGPVPDQR